MRSAWTRAAATSATGPLLHAAIGTPTSSASFFEAILSPSRSITSGDGPMNTMPSWRHMRAKSDFSETKPQPGQTASASHSRRALASSA